MNGPWYWYLRFGEYGQGDYVKIHAEKPGAVRGRWWVIPFRNHKHERWNVYLEPKDKTNRNGEWVFHHRTKWEPPPKKHEIYSVDVCPCCGQEFEV